MIDETFAARMLAKQAPAIRGFVDGWAKVAWA